MQPESTSFIQFIMNLTLDTEDTDPRP